MREQIIIERNENSGLVHQFFLTYFPYICPLMYILLNQWFTSSFHPSTGMLNISRRSPVDYFCNMFPLENLEKGYLNTKRIREENIKHSWGQFLNLSITILINIACNQPHTHFNDFHRKVGLLIRFLFK